MEKCIFTESSRETRTSLNTSEGISAVDIVILWNIPRKEYFGSLLLLLGKDERVRARSSREGCEGWPKSYNFSVLSDYPDLI